MSLEKPGRLHLDIKMSSFWVGRIINISRYQYL